MEKQKPSTDNFETRKSSKKKISFFYFDAEDESLWIRKQSSFLGRRLNFANPLAYIVVLLAILVVVLATRLI